ncbi:MAG: class I SAM-dependent methyltransferase [Pseudobutyrivibrio sp.]|nr:class I SAM-dependent methyltransferase [Pseudobutyrivibrio sp.]
MQQFDLDELNKKLIASGLELMRDEEGLHLIGGGLSLMADFKDMLPRLKQSNLEHEILIKAARIKSMPMPQTVVDATAGLGEDSLILAAAGFNVVLYEYDSVIAALLDDALERAKSIPELKDIVARMELHNENSIEAMQKLDFTPDIVLLDPMFPERQKSAKIKKKFQLLQQLESPCSDEIDMFQAAESTGAKRIVVKRPAKGPQLAAKKPSHNISGKAIRYDCYIYA